MVIDDVKQLATSLMSQYVPSWTLGFDNSQRRFGVCYYQTKHISLSIPLCELNPESEVRNTILHEIAHALSGSEAGHNGNWIRVARSIGCDGKRCYDSLTVAAPAGRFIAMCPNCLKMYRRVRPPKRIRSCGVCSPVFDAKFALKWNKLPD